MSDYDSSNLEQTCRDLFKAFEPILTWKWDDRFETVLAEFKVQDQDRVTRILQNPMGHVWDTDNYKKAPKIVNLIIDFFGGIQPGQKLFTSKADADDILIGAWWPWGNGETISIRLGVYIQSLSDDENRELTLEFKGWFGL